MVTWQEPENGKSAIVAYLCYNDSLPILETRRKPTSQEKRAIPHMFLDVEATVNPDDVVETDKRIAYTMRLPYTAVMLERRIARGASVPDHLKAQVFEVGKVA